MKKTELNNLWILYREFCIACNQANMVNSVPEFLVWIEKFKINKNI